MKRLFLVFFCLVFLLLTGCREQSKEELFRQGLEFSTNGNHQAAVTLFRNALDKDPNYADARIQLGTAYIETGKFDKAENELEKVLLQEPGNAQVSLRLADLYVRTNKPEKAIRQLEILNEKDPNDLETLRLLATSNAMLGELQTAEELFRQALLIAPADAQSQLGLAQLLFVNAQSVEARTLVDAVLQQAPDNTDAYYLLFRQSLVARDRDGAIDALEKIRAVKLEDMFAAYMLGMLYLDAGRNDDARRIAAQITARNPEHPAGHRIEGVVLYQEGRFEQAIQALQKSINGMPDLPGFYFLGLANYQFGQLEQALSSFQKALDKSPEHPQSRLMVAQTLLKQGRVDDSLHQAALVIEKNPDNAAAHNLLGSAYLLKGKYDLAMEHIDEAIRINPGLAQAHLKKGLFNLAAGNRAQGEQGLLNAIDAAPEVLNTRLLLASYYLRQNNYPKALEVLEEGLTISPDSALIYNLLAAVKFGQNKPEQAIQHLQKAKTLKPDYFAPYFNLANYYASRKDYQAAQLEYQAVLAVDPSQLQALLKSAALYEFTDQDDLAEAVYKKAAATESVQGFLALGSFQERKGRHDAALETLKSGTATHPGNAELMIAYAQKLKSLERFDEAIAVYVHLEETHPGVGKPLLVGAHLHKGNDDAAREIAERAIAEKPESEQGYLMQSAIHESKSDWASAEKVLQKGISVCKQNLRLRMDLAGLQGMQGKHDKAIELYNGILQDHPDYLPALFAKASFLDLAGDKKQAKALYERILAADENHVAALNNLAMIELDVYANRKSALELAAKGFRLRPGDPRIVDTLGYALLKNNQVDNAIVFLEKAARLLPDEASVQLHLAQAYKAAGRPDEAVARLTSINQASAKEPELRAAKALLKELN